MSTTNRRGFLKASVGAGSLLGFGDMSFLSQLRPVAAAELRLDPKTVQFRDEIEPLVRLLEETPRGRLLEEIADRVRKGLSYREVLTALLLAGVRNVQPRPAVGFKFHAVLVVNSAHLASLSAPDSDRWLPIFWALDEFKSSQARDVQEGNWTMPPVDESKVPVGEQAQGALVAAFNSWDEQAADTAVAGLVRSAGANSLFEIFARYGARDFRSIGHKAIFVANSFRTLNCIGWQHAEPVLRSLAYALQNHQGDPNPHDNDLDADRPWRQNKARVATIRQGWRTGKLDSQATVDFLSTLRTGTYDDACDQVVELLNRGISPQSIYDAMFLGAGELLMRQPGIVALHAVTTTNALHYACRTVADDETRRLLLLQNAAFLPMFRQAMQQRGRVGAGQLDKLALAALVGSEEETAADIFRQVSGDRAAASQKVLAYLQQGYSAESLISSARRLIFLKGNNAHDYKFSSAVLEDFYHISPTWRDRFLATSVFNLRGSDDKDNSLVRRIREALKA